VAALRSAQVMGAGAAWLLTGSQTIGRTLIRALTSEGEDERAIAGMFLVKGGERGRRLVSDALHRGVESEELITVLQSIGGPEAEAELAELAQHEDRPVSGSAKRALLELQEIRRRGQQA
jgi:HEAT repeat protein